MKIQKLQEHELTLFFKYATLESWDTEEVHTIALYKTHPDDFFIAYKSEQLLGFIVAIKHSDEFGFISSFLVLKEFRSLGYGREIFNFALKHLKGRQIALDSVVDKTTLYERVGFKAYFDVITYSFKTGSVELPSSEIETVDFNENLALFTDKEYMNTILANDKVNYRAVKSASLISSYAFTFEYRDGYKIHIESKDINEALTLFFSLTDELKKGTNIYLQASKLSPLLLAIVQALKMSETSKHIRMYNKCLIS